MYIAPRPPPLPRPRPRGVRPRPPRLPRPPRGRPELLGSGVLGNSSLIGLSIVSLRSGVSPMDAADELRLLLDRGVWHIEGILSKASVIRGNFILELVGSISTVGRSSLGSSGEGLMIVIDGDSIEVVISARRAPRPRPRPRGL